jgi:DNA-binding response OmpR family regulator
VQKTPLLVVDDDAAIRKLLHRIAQRAGFDVDSAKDGIEALEMMQLRRYDIAIVDLMMPRLSGYELIQKVSELEHRPCLIVASAATSGEISLDDSVVRRVIKKPFDISAVANTLVEVAKQIADERGATPSTIPVAGTDVKITVSEDCASPEERADGEDPSDKRAPC